jgi:NDP-sugar pyrophosphorylase family protein
LRTFGIREVIINVHHFADTIVEYLKRNSNFGMRIEISREEALLDTGGGLKKAAHFFLEDSTNLEEPFILHNVDVISTIDLQRMAQFHVENRVLATLAVNTRESSRYLLFNEELHLCGRRVGSNSKTELVRPAEYMQALAFCGVHIISPLLLSMITEEGAFSIIDAYLGLANREVKILAFRADQYYWRDLGTPGGVIQATRDVEQQIIPQ